MNYLEVGKYKGDWDFGVKGTVVELTYDEMQDLRGMIIVAIGTMEDMWRREQERKNSAKAV